MDDRSITILAIIAAGIIARWLYGWQGQREAERKAHANDPPAPGAYGGSFEDHIAADLTRLRRWVSRRRR